MTIFYSDSIERYSVIDLGYDKTLTKPLLFTTAPTPELAQVIQAGVAAQSLTSGGLVSLLETQGGGIFSGKTAFDNTQDGFRLGVDDDGVAKFYIGSSTEYLNWDGTNLTIAGALTASSGSIGGFDIGTDYIRDAANSFGMVSTVTVGDDIRFWAGATFANRASAPFRVSEAGALVATNVTLSGSVAISGIANNTSTDISLLDATHDLTFSSTDADTVSWGSGTITLSNGRAFSISAGNTGNMAARTFIYLSPSDSATVLQTTTTATTAMGANKKIIAIAENATDGAVFQVLGGKGGITITPASVITDTLSAITADLGAITAGTIVLASTGYIRSGQTNYRAGTGWWLGLDGATPKFSIGNATSGPELYWDGSVLKLTNVTLIRAATAGEDIAGATTPKAVFIGDDTITTIVATSNVGTSVSIATTQRVALKYIPGATERANIVRVLALRDLNMTSNVTVSIQADSAGEPSGTPLSSATIPYTNFTATEALVTSPALSPTIELTGSATYWIVVELANTAETEALTFDYSTGGSQTSAVYDSGSWVVDTSSTLGLGLGLKYIGGELWLSKSDITERSKFDGFVVNTVSLGDTDAQLLHFGTIETFSGLTPGTKYQISAAYGGIEAGSTTEVGKAFSATQLLVKSY